MTSQDVLLCTAPCVRALYLIVSFCARGQSSVRKDRSWGVRRRLASASVSIQHDGQTQHPICGRTSGLRDAEGPRKPFRRLNGIELRKQLIYAQGFSCCLSLGPFSSQTPNLCAPGIRHCEGSACAENAAWMMRLRRATMPHTCVRLPAVPRPDVQTITITRLLLESSNVSSTSRPALALTLQLNYPDTARHAPQERHRSRRSSIAVE